MCNSSHKFHFQSALERSSVYDSSIIEVQQRGTNYRGVENTSLSRTNYQQQHF